MNINIYVLFFDMFLSTQCCLDVVARTCVKKQLCTRGPALEGRFHQRRETRFVLVIDPNFPELMQQYPDNFSIAWKTNLETCKLIDVIVCEKTLQIIKELFR